MSFRCQQHKDASVVLRDAGGEFEVVINRANFDWLCPEPIVIARRLADSGLARAILAPIIGQVNWLVFCSAAADLLRNFIPAAGPHLLEGLLEGVHLGGVGGEVRVVVLLLQS